MTWFATDDGFPEHPKVDRLEALSAGDWSRYAAARMVWHDMGCDCARRLTDGAFLRVRAHRVCRLPREVVDVALADLVGAGLILTAGDGFAFHDWNAYQPTRAKVEAMRASKTERQRRWRDRVDASTEPSTGASTNASTSASTGASTSASRDASVDAAPSPPLPSPPLPSSSETPNGVSSAASQSAAPNADEEGDEEKPSRKPPRPDAPAPLPGTPEHTVMRALVAAPLLSERVSRPHEFCRAAASAFAGLDVPREIARAEAWVTANPRRRPVNAGRFLHAWLAKAQDRAATTGAAQHQRASLFSPPAPVQSGTDRILDPRTKQFVTRAEYEASRGR